MGELIFLASSFAQVGEIFKSKILTEYRVESVAFFDTAAEVEDIRFYVESAHNTFTSMGIEINKIDLNVQTPTEVEMILQDSDAIYVSGGNSFYVMQEFKRLGIDHLLIRQVQSGKLYIGESAGAIIASPDIAYVQKMDDASRAPELKETAGLNIVDFFTLPHYGNEPFKAVAEEIKVEYASELNIIPISNKQAIISTLSSAVNEHGAGNKISIV